VTQTYLSRQATTAPSPHAQRPPCGRLRSNGVLGNKQLCQSKTVPSAGCSRKIWEQNGNCNCRTLYNTALHDLGNGQTIQPHRVSTFALQADRPLWVSLLRAILSSLESFVSRFSQNRDFRNVGTFGNNSEKRIFLFNSILTTCSAGREPPHSRSSVQMTPPQTRSHCAATSSEDPAIRIEKGLNTDRARRRSRLRRVIPLELPPLLGECFGLTANVCPLDREIQYRTRLFAGL
jgi:hypothetical protein